MALDRDYSDFFFSCFLGVICMVGGPSMAAADPVAPDAASPGHAAGHRGGENEQSKGHALYSLSLYVLMLHTGVLSPLPDSLKTAMLLSFCNHGCVVCPKFSTGS